jgi:hypothetical protein
MSNIDIDNITDKTKEVLEYMSMGLPAKKAYQLAKPGKEITRQHEHRIQKMFEKWAVNSPKLQKLAHLAIKDTLEMKEIEGIKPTVTNRLTAVQMVLDRTEPVIKINHNLNANIEISPVDLSKYRQG